MGKEIMGMQEQAIAVMNIKSIESMLGHPISAGMVDVNQLGKKILSSSEVYAIAANIRSVEQNLSIMRNETPEEAKRTIAFYQILAVIAGIPLLAFFIYAAIYVIQGL